MTPLRLYASTFSFLLNLFKCSLEVLVNATSTKPVEAFLSLLDL